MAESLQQPTVGSVIIDGTAYSGADIKVIIHLYDQDSSALSQQIQDFQATLTNPGVTDKEKSDLSSAITEMQNKLKTKNQTKVLAEAQTLSVSTYREKYPVRSLSTVYPKGFTRGPRTIAGSIVFSVFDKNVLYEILQADTNDYDANRSISSALIDQLPPFDITVNFANELGQTSTMVIYGCEFVSEGQTMSIHDLFIENTAQYVALDIDPMTATGTALKDENMRITGQEMFGGSIAGSDLADTPAAKSYDQENDPFKKFNVRNDPFL